jgi:predicted ArsR family transcriptional regulator
MPTARKVLTPGSKMSPGQGRPKKAQERSKAGYSRVGNNRHNYTQAMFLEAIEAVKGNTMTARQAAREYGVPKSTILDRISAS